MNIRTIIEYKAYCDVCEHYVSPNCATTAVAAKFLSNHKRTNYHKRNANS